MRYSSFERTRIKAYVILFITFFVSVLFVATSSSSSDKISIIVARFDLRLLPACVLGLATVFVLAKFVARFDMPRAIFSSIGRRSLCFFPLEGPCAYVLYRIGLVPYENMMKHEHSCTSGFLRVILVLALAWVASYPTLWVLNKLRTKSATR